MRMAGTLAGAYPAAGEIITETGGVRKIRWALEGRGKRGGARRLLLPQRTLRFPPPSSERMPCTSTVRTLRMVSKWRISASNSGNCAHQEDAFPRRPTTPPTQASLRRTRIIRNRTRCRGGRTGRRCPRIQSSKLRCRHSLTAGIRTNGSYASQAPRRPDRQWRR